MKGCQSQGEALLLVSAALSSGIARGRSVEDVAVLAALFTLIGDQLALLATLCGEEAEPPTPGPLPSRG